MKNVSFIDVLQVDGTMLTFAIIDKGNNEFTSMTKEHYEATYGPIEGAE